MIELTCTSCSEPMRIEDAFAGGVVRCKSCKAIQTVPSKRKLEQRKGPVPQPIRTPTTLHNPALGSGTGLEELGEVVSSGGMGVSSRLGHRSPQRPRRSPQPQPVTPAKGRSWWPIAVGGGLLAVALIVAGVMVLGGDDATPVVPQRVSSLVLPETGTVVYVVDIGPSFVEHRREIARLLYQSVESLAEGRSLQVVLAGEVPVLRYTSAPAQRTVTTPGEIEDRIAATADELASDLPAALRVAELSASGSQGGVVILISAKAWQVSSDLAGMSSKSVPVYTVAIGGDHFEGTFAKLAESTGGRSVVLSAAELQRATAR